HVNRSIRPGAPLRSVSMLGRSWVEMSATAPIPRAIAPRPAPPVAGAREDRRARCRRRVGKTPTPRPSTKLLCLRPRLSRTTHAQAKNLRRAGALPRSCRVPLLSDPSRNGGHREVQAPVDYRGGGKAAFLVMPPAPQCDGTDAELRPQLRAGNELAPLEI